MEKRRVKEQEPIFPLRLDLSATDVYYVREKLEGVEGDTDRQGYGGKSVVNAEYRREGIGGEVGVLEDKQYGNTDSHRYAAKRLFLFLVPRAIYHYSAAPADEGHQAEQKHENRSSPGVEDKGEH